MRKEISTQNSWCAAFCFVMVVRKGALLSTQLVQQGRRKGDLVLLHLHDPIWKCICGSYQVYTPACRFSQLENGWGLCVWEVGNPFRVGIETPSSHTLWFLYHRIKACFCLLTFWASNYFAFLLEFLHLSVLVSAKQTGKPWSRHPVPDVKNQHECLKKAKGRGAVYWCSLPSALSSGLASLQAPYGWIFPGSWHF